MWVVLKVGWEGLVLSRLPLCLHLHCILWRWKDGRCTRGCVHNTRVCDMWDGCWFGMCVLLGSGSVLQCVCGLAARAAADGGCWRDGGTLAFKNSNRPASSQPVRARTSSHKCRTHTTPNHSRGSAAAYLTHHSHIAALISISGSSKVSSLPTSPKAAEASMITRS